MGAHAVLEAVDAGVADVQGARLELAQVHDMFDRRGDALLKPQLQRVVAGVLQPVGEERFGCGWQSERVHDVGDLKGRTAGRARCRIVGNGELPEGLEVLTTKGEGYRKLVA